MPAGSGRDSANETLWPGTDQIFPVCRQQRLPNQIIVFGITVLDQCTLHGFFVGISGNIDLFHGTGIQSGVIHDR